MRLTAPLFTLACLIPGALPSQTPRVPVWTLKEDLRIGGAADGPENFVDLRGIGITKSGNIFVLAYDTQELRVFDAQGNFLKRAARRGAGPGELSSANGLAVGSNDVVWVNDPGNNRFSLYQADGTYLKQVLTPIQGFGYIWHGVVVSDGRILDDLPVSIPTGERDPKTGRPTFRSRLRFVNANGTADTVNYPVCPNASTGATATLIFGASGQHGQAYVSLPYFPFKQVVFTPRGAWCTPSDAYRLFAGGISDTLRLVVQGTFPPAPVTDSERKAALIRVDSARIKYGALQSGDPNAIPRTKPAIAQLYADQAGNAWVRRNGVPKDAPVLEVWDPSGHQLATVNSTGPVGDQTWIDGDVLLTVVLDQDDIPYVVRYRIVR